MITKDNALHALWGLLLLSFGYIFNETTQHLENLSKDVDELKYTVAADCVRKSDLNRFEAKLDHMNDLIISLIKEDRKI